MRWRCDPLAPEPTRDPELQALRARRLRELQAQAAGAAPAGGDGAPAAPIDATDATLDGVLREHATVAVDLWAPWCGPCRVLGPVLEELAQELSGRVTIAKVNVDENPRTAQRFRVSGIPTVLVFRDGELKDRVVGVAPKGQLRERFLAHAQ